VIVEQEPIRLWWPKQRCLGGICLGATKEEILSRGDFFEDLPEGPDDESQRLSKIGPPEMAVSLADGVAWAIGAYDECLLDDVDLIGLPLDAAAWRLGGIEAQTLEGEVEIFRTASGVELYVREGNVCQVYISDESLIKDEDFTVSRA
jgi:hypothetical protein